MKRIIIAIDGPAASGKSTTARLLAQKLGYVYLDTGAMYRACALAAQRAGIDPSDEAALDRLLLGLNLRVAFTDQGNRVFLNDEDISGKIRTPELSLLASSISAIPAVRRKMVDLQRKLGDQGGVILDGRDIGTVVFPQAELKFFMIAPAEIRAQRRFLELQEKGMNPDFQVVLKEMQERDKADAERALAPLIPANDAIEIDTGSLSIEEQVEALYQIIVSRVGTQ